MEKSIIQPNKVALLTTNKCTASCKMCCFSCSPQNNDFFDEEVVERIISNLNTNNTINTLGFSGGEPFLLFEDLIKITKRVSENGISVICTSNGFWGGNYDDARAKLKEFKKAGLRKLSLSVDNFHQEYIPVKNIKNILNICKQLNIPVDIGSVLTESTSDLSNVLKDIGIELVGVPHYRTACLPIGNALKYIPEDDYIYDEHIIEEDNKCFETSYFAIYLNGDVYPCCSQAGVIPVLKLGNVKENNFDDLLKSYHRNMYCRIMKKYGFKWFCKAAQVTGHERLLENKFVNKCHLCNLLFSNEEYIKSINPLLEEEKEKIYQDYLRWKDGSRN